MTQGNNSLLEVTDVAKYFRARRGLKERIQRTPEARVVALDGVSLRLARNETMGIVGESGSGKTTLARCLVRLIEPDGGSIRFDGTDVLGASRDKLRDVRRAMQLIYQDPYSSLNPRMSVGAAVVEPARVHGLVEKKGESAFIAELLERVGLSFRVAARRPRELSGGQRQRVAIARALALNPRVLLADEAVSALDVSIQAQILNLLRQLVDDLGISIIFISHQLSVVAQLCERVAIMYLGRIVETGPCQEVFANPKHPYTIALLEAHPTLEVLGRPSRPALRGELPSPLAIPSGCRFHTRCPFVEEICREVDPPGIPVASGHVSWCHVLPREPAATRHGRGGATAVSS